jgi:nicotinate-nucleotide pyrophosphorylase (carboxylating)
MSVPPLATIMIEPLVRAALLEDLGRAGDITTDAIVPAAARANTALVARQAGVVAGLDLALLAFRLVDPSIVAKVERPDGSRLAPGDMIATVTGPARGILTAERVALNFLCHLSGIATATASIVEAVRGHRARITCTRKTTPGLRAVQKYAVRVGGGANHRFGLDDAVLIKDNHIAAAGGIRPAVERARSAVGHLVKIEIEVDTLAQLEEALAVERSPVAARVLRNTMASVALRRPDERTAALRDTIAELLGMDEPRRRFAAMMSGLDIHYDLGEGHPLLGRRMPDLDLSTANGPLRVFTLLRDARPVLLNFGEPGGFDITPWPDRVQLVDAKYVGPWELPALGAVTAPTAVLIRPDGYVAWVGDSTLLGLTDTLTTWFGPPAAG